MSDHVVTLYEIRNAFDLALDYRLVAIDGYLGAIQGDDDLVERNLNGLARQVAFREKTAVAIVREGANSYLAVPAQTQFSNLEYHLTPSAVSLRPEETVRGLRLTDLDKRHIALKFIEFSLRGPLSRNHELWSPSPRTLMKKRPVNFHESDREVDLFEGFHFHLRFLDNRLFLAVNLSYKYIDSAWLVDRFKPEEMRHLKMRHLLYHFGNRWYVVQLLDVLPATIAQHRFLPDGASEPISVFDYTGAKSKEHPPCPPWIVSLNPNSPAITYRYPGRDNRNCAAAALAKLIHRTDAPEVRSLHRRSIKHPADRFRFTRDIVERYFQRAQFAGTELQIADSAHRVSPKIFAVPSLEFGQGQVLKVAPHSGNGSIRLKDLPTTRMSMLLDPQAGFAVTSPLDAQYMLIPQTLNREIASDFRKGLESAVRDFTHTSYKLDPVLYDDRNARSLKEQVDAISNALKTARVTHGHGVLILPPRAHRGLHNHIKANLNDTIQVQCVSATTLQSYYNTVLRAQRGAVEVRPDLRGRYTSYLRYTALGLLIVNRQWGWVLRNGTHYDAYISFDVLNNHAAFSFFYEGGKKCFVRTHPSRQKEKLLKAQVKQIVYDGLKQDLARGVSLNSIVLRRDGRLFESEWQGFSEAVSQLVREKLLPAGLVTGAVEVHKTSANGLRIAKVEIDGLRNPRIDVALELSPSEGIVCNTGYPFKLNGSVNPLQLRLVRGDLSLSQVLEDTFRMSLLSYPVPDRVMRLPIDMKLCDEFLRAVASESDEDEALYGDGHEQFAEAVNAS